VATTVYGTPQQVIGHASDLLKQLDASAIQARLGPVSRRVDGRLARHFDVPLTEVPDLVKEATTMIVAGQLLRRSVQRGGSRRVSDEGKALVDAGMAILDDIRDEPSILGIPLKTVTATDQKRDRVSFALPRETPIADINTPAEELELHDGEGYEGV